MQDDAPSGTIPLRLQTYDLLGINPPTVASDKADRLLATVYGLMQIVLSGMPPLTDKGRADATIAALMRDATISIAGCLATARAKLYEPTVRVSRGVLEARLYVQHIRGSVDPDGAAELFAVDRLLARKRNLQDSIAKGLRKADDPWAKKHFDDIDGALSDPQLKRAHAELNKRKQANKAWHGQKSLRLLAEHLSDPGAYYLIYAPASAFFVHPGDPDTHLMADGNQVVVRPLAVDDDDKLGSTMLTTAAEGHHLLAEATAPWNLGAEIRLAIDQLVRLMLIDAMSPSLEGDEMDALESAAGIPREMWSDLVSVTFDWPGPPANGQNR